MCGIVGYIGNKNVAEVLINGLRRLEYRGYDSVGIAALNNKLIVQKQKGKVSELNAILNYDDFKGFSAGIGHTRWATHGEPNDTNAHPHTDCSGEIALVHNGIIENYAAIKKILLQHNHTIKSETDTEVLVHLIEYYHQTMPLVDAVQKTLTKVEGTYGIVVISKKEPDKLVAARNGSPLIIGVGDGEMIVASDASAIVEHTRNVIYVSDGEIIEITRNGVKTFDLKKQTVEKHTDKIDWDIADIEKQGFAHFMLKEIFEQPETIQNAFRGRILLDEGKTRLDGLRLTEDELNAIRRIIFIACGTSWHAGLIGEYLIEEYARIPVEVEYASEFRYRSPILDKGDLVIVISQSGETADTLAALREAKARGVKVLGITNVVGSTIARESDGGVYIHAGPEIGVASTKAFTSQITVLILLTFYFARRKYMTADAGREFLQELINAPQHVKQILDKNDEIKKIAQLYKEHRNFLYLGRGIQFPVALEGALKLKEISYIHAEGYPAAEMKHGPIALIDENMPVVFIAVKDEVYQKVISNIQEVKARKGKIIAIATEGDEDIKKYADHVLYVPQTRKIVSPLLTVIPLQLLAYHIAVLRGCNVDQPRNLAKSVTVE
ncbi:MAG TPA: glutamine--fructose-6-phosphate transaminase (isomerizing) [Spirochaetota bacterium]|nr:glutamine--fructose-6-phosphate transaminase (isomerizing) [Spirochaetota bacterium]HOM08789.1 glutamine--fructose-6-phosphate transaminase (isomerizing) [Spirochaetota bacterium]HPP50170.1 glutamine--fructose-6-phosphate transaminase (isomerizing) [Spirochaetota bacterium]